MIFSWWVMQIVDDETILKYDVATFDSKLVILDDRTITEKSSLFWEI